MSKKNLDPRCINPTGAKLSSELSSIACVALDPKRVRLVPTPTVRDIFASDPLNLASRKKPLRILLPGGTGDLAGRFLLPAYLSLCAALPWFRDLVQFIPVGTRPRGAGSVRVTELRAAGLSLAEYRTSDQALREIQAGSLQVDAVFIATLPRDHLTHCATFLSAIPRVPVFCEKPLWVPEDLKQGQELLRHHPGRLYAIDCFATATPIFWMLGTPEGRSFLKALGAFRVVNGSVVEDQPVEVHRLGGDLGLLRAGISGGGMALDCGIHSLTTCEILYRNSEGAERLPISRHFAQSTYLTPDYLSAKLTPGCGLKLEDFRETAGVVSNVYSRCVVNGQGMKGVASTAYLFEIITQKSERVVIGIGTDTRPPYIVHSKEDGGTDVRTFAGPYVTVGYEGTLYNMCAEILGVKAISPAADLLMEVALECLHELGSLNHPPQEFERYALGSFPERHIPIPDVEAVVPALK